MEIPCSGHPVKRLHTGHLNLKLSSSFPITALDIKVCRHSSQNVCEHGKLASGFHYPLQTYRTTKMNVSVPFFPFGRHHGWLIIKDVLHCGILYTFIFPDKINYRVCDSSVCRSQSCYLCALTRFSETFYFLE